MKTHIFTILFFLFSGLQFVSAQQKDSTYLLWVTGSFGSYGTFIYQKETPTEEAKGSGGFGYATSVNILHHGITYKLSFAANSDFNILGPYPQEQFYQYNAMAGKAINKKRLLISFCGGLGVISGTKRGDRLNEGLLTSEYETENFMEIAVPLEFELFGKLSRYFAVGVGYTANLNATSPQHNLYLLKLAVGKVR
jgi:hypothetical protein